jgi:hypothetical protein
LRRQRPHRGNFTGGMFVMYWRPGKGESSGQWHGPARINPRIPKCCLGYPCQPCVSRSTRAHPMLVGARSLTEPGNIGPRSNCHASESHGKRGFPI